MRRGPRRTPIHLKLVKGDLRGLPAAGKTARPNSRVPVPPDFIDRGARREWRRLAPELSRVGLLTEIDRAALAAYCQSYSQWTAAQNALAKMAAMDSVTYGMLVKTTNGNAVQNPLLGIANKAKSDMVRYAAEFGMTPDSRGRIAVNPAGVGAHDPSEEFFR
jgi:P27 family predicted phage terminase small subunit